MRRVACFAILSFLACQGPRPADVGGAPQGVNAAGTPASSEVSAGVFAVDVGAAGSEKDAVVAQEDAAGSEAPPSDLEAARAKAIRLVEHRGDAMSPVMYRVVEPDDAGPTTPLVLALHGRGDTAAGFVGLARRLELRARVVVVEAPLPFGNIGGRQWFEAAKAEAMRPRLDELERLVERLARQYPEAGKPIILGFSQGAMMAMLAVAERPERYRAAVALSGRMAEGVAGVSEAKTPVLVVAGTKDGIISQESSWSAADTLAAMGREVERFNFVGAHTVPPAAIEAVRAFFARVVQ